MLDIINLLPDSVANQIAAGEVVDRPASAVKELLENAIDAKATAIRLIVKDAGRTLIQVVDNGVGMSDNDARMCFERHATSKIHQANDLYSIHTMGFRGEALASIAAVAQVELRTRMSDSELGCRVIIEGSDVKSQEPCSCDCGTSIAVKNLFFNLPARRTFLKKDSIELSHIEETFRRITLVYPQVAFVFHHNEKLLYNLPAGTMAQRIVNLMGAQYRGLLCPVEQESEVVNVSGFVCKPEFARRSKNEQYLFVNGRYIKHPYLSAAVERAYSELIPERMHPAFFLHLSVDPQRIDVNIHPTKTEVRFADESTIFAILRAATKRALGQFSITTELEFNPSPDLDFTPAPQGYVPKPPTVHYNPNYNPFQSQPHSQPSSSTTARISTDNYRSPWENFFDMPNSADSTSPQNDSEEATYVESSVNTSFQDGQQSIDTWATSEAADDQPAAFTQVNNQYIVTAIQSGLLVVDQQRATERIGYERLMHQLSQKGAATAQQLLFPENCSFSPADAELLGQLQPQLESMGFCLSPMGKSTFVITATPPNITPSELHPLLENILSDYKSSMMTKFSNRDQMLCQSMARQMSTKTGKVLQAAEMQTIVANLLSCQVPGISPSGHKTMMVLTPANLKEMLR